MNEKKFTIGLLILLVVACAGGFLWVRHWLDCQYGLCPIRESWDFDGLRLTLSSPQRQYEVGDEVTITAKVENISRETILWQSAKGENREYVFDVEVEGVLLSSLYPEMQVYSREMKPGEKIEITYTFKPRKQVVQRIVGKAYIYHLNGMGKDYESIILNYGPLSY